MPSTNIRQNKQKKRINKDYIFVAFVFCFKQFLVLCSGSFFVGNFVPSPNFGQKKQKKTYQTGLHFCCLFVLFFEDVDDVEQFERTINAMATIGIKGDQITACMNCVSSVLNLGTIGANRRTCFADIKRGRVGKEFGFCWSSFQLALRPICEDGKARRKPEKPTVENNFLFSVTNQFPIRSSAFSVYVEPCRDSAADFKRL